MIFREVEHWIQVSWVLQAALLAGILLFFAGVLVRRRARSFREIPT